VRTEFEHFLDQIPNIYTQQHEQAVLSLQETNQSIRRTQDSLTQEGTVFYNEALVEATSSKNTIELMCNQRGIAANEKCIICLAEQGIQKDADGTLTKFARFCQCSALACPECVPSITEHYDKCPVCHHPWGTPPSYDPIGVNDTSSNDDSDSDVEVIEQGFDPDTPGAYPDTPQIYPDSPDSPTQSLPSP